MQNNDEWTRWSNFVLEELKRLNRNQEATSKEIGDIRVEIGMLQVRAGVWGALGGFIPVAIMLILKYVK